MRPLMARIFSVRSVFLLASYGVIFTFSLTIAYAIRYDFGVPQYVSLQAWRNLLWILPLKLVLMLAFGQFNGLLSYFRLPDVLRIFYALLTASLLMLGYWYWWGGQPLPPRSVILGDLLFSLVMVCGFRMLLRVVRERLFSMTSTPTALKRVAIVGAGDSGAAITSELLAKRGFGMRPVVLLDDDPQKIGQYLYGIPILKIPHSFEGLQESYLLEGLIIAMPSASPERTREIIRASQAASLETKIAPSLSQTFLSHHSARALRPVELEDLLGREPINLQTDQIEEIIRDKTVMVTGAGGSIGMELCRQISSYNPSRLLLVEQCESKLFEIEQDLLNDELGAPFTPLLANVLHRDRMEEIFRTYKPELIFHAAAHKHVPMLESQPLEALRNNSAATIRLGEMALRHGVSTFVNISTDKAINPTSIMGASKRLSEILLKALYAQQGNFTRICSVRFGNVLGSSGSVIPTFKRQIAEGGPVTVTHPEVTRYFMTIPEAVGLVLQSSAICEGGEIYVLDMGKPLRILDIANQLIELSGLKPGTDIDVKITGLRPGEKLFEELRHTGENFENTSHSKIVRFKSGTENFETVHQALESLLDPHVELSVPDIKRAVQKVIPEYKPYIP